MNNMTEMSANNETQTNTQGRRTLLGMSKSKIALLLWCLFSIPFVAFQAWTFLEANMYQAGVRFGAQQTSIAIYGDLITKASNSKCETIFVQQEDRRVDLINVKCLQAVAPATAPAAATPSTN